MEQVARNLTDVVDGFLGDHRLLICDRDSKFTDQFQLILVDSGVEVVLTPRQDPNCNAYAERFVLSHARRQILHVTVTEHPTASWTARQLLEAFPFEAPRLSHRDRDRIYGWEFNRTVETLGIHQIRSAPRSPWQNAFAERVIGTIHRECTDHTILFGRRHLLRTLMEYVEYYNSSRPHQSLDRNTPVPRWVDVIGEVCVRPVLGGLHHRYSRAA